MLERILEYVHRQAVERPIIVLLGLLAAFVSFFAFARPLEVQLTVDDLPSESFPEVAVYKAMQRDFHLGTAFVVGFESQDGKLSNQQACLIHDWLWSVRSNPSVLRVSSPLHVSRFLYQEERLYQQTLIPLDCRQDRSPLQALPLKPLAGSPFQDLLVGKTGQIWLVALEFWTPPEEASDPQDPIQIAGLDPKILSVFAETTETYFRDRAPKLKVHLAGAGAFRLALYEALLHDQVMNIALLAFALLGFWLLYGQARYAVLLGLKIILLCLLLLGAMASAGSSLDVLSNSLVLLVVVSASQDFLLFLQLANFPHEGRQGESPSLAWQEALRRILVPSFLTSFTSAATFLCLLLSDYPPLQNFGVWAAVGVFFEWLVTFVVMPAFLKVCPFFMKRSKGSIRRFTNRFSPSLGPRQLLRGRYALFIATAGLITLFSAPLSLSWLEVNDSPEHHLSAEHPLVRSHKSLVHHFDWASRVYLRVGEGDETLDSHRERELVQSIGTLGNVSATENPEGILTWATKDLPEPLARSLQDDFISTPVGESYRQSHGADRLLRLYLKDESLVALSSLRTNLSEICLSWGLKCELGETSVIYAAIVERLLADLVHILVASLLVVGVTVFALAWSAGYTDRTKATVILLLAAFAGPAATAWTLALLHVDIGLTAALGIVVLVGMTGDNAIHFLWAARKEGHGACLMQRLDEGIRSRGTASLKIAFFAGACSLALLLSDLRSVQTLGLFLLLGLFWGYLGDVWFLRALSQCIRSFGKERNPSS